ncbi:MAG: hypothetical protein M0Z83_01565 [Betaproteobacteria bacterium]|nr:hypothetical protein [Betaproteobacteria bacterium]
MPVKNVGSKLVRGVRQIKEQQDIPPTTAVSENTPVAAKVKTLSPRAKAKPALAKASKSGIQHPDRVWPD